ncbi:hypothetical protein Pcac1_g5218 [Phytophthora cactorum]|nr:hypothetical protein Pcac1_g5218 [Phytophthora cactorum]
MLRLNYAVFVFGLNYACATVFWLNFAGDRAMAEYYSYVWPNLDGDAIGE